MGKDNRVLNTIIILRNGSEDKSLATKSTEEKSTSPKLIQNYNSSSKAFTSTTYFMTCINKILLSLSMKFFVSVNALVGFIK